MFLHQTIYGAKEKYEKITSKGPTITKGDDDLVATKDLMDMNNQTNFLSSHQEDDIDPRHNQVAIQRLDKVDE